jgi:hypothetical protein
VKSREQIIEAIKRTAAENGGAPVGQSRFETMTGIPRGAWRGKYWRVWSEALEEAGFAPNPVNEAHTRQVLVLALAKLTRQHRRFPTYTELLMAKRAGPDFPTHSAFQRLGSQAVRVELLRTYATEHPEYRDVLALLPPPEADDTTAGAEQGELGADGCVYMLKLGKHFKIGKTFSVPRRHQEIAIELPEKPDVVHVITTDDPSGIEAYWHGRFASKNTNGEWFALTRDDVRAFKRRRFM